MRATPRAMIAIIVVAYLVIAILVSLHIVWKYHLVSRELDICTSIIDKEGVTRFLRSQYVPSIGLLRASVYTYPDNITAYVANDNVLATRALEVLGERELASAIRTKLDREYAGGFNYKIEVLFGVNIPDLFYTVRYEELGEIDGYRVVYERQGDKVLEDWYGYADLLVYRALDKLLEGSRNLAELLFINLTTMWDGYGFRDKAFNATGVYAVYKCALFIFIYRALEFAGSRVIEKYVEIKNACAEIISRAQDQQTGGVKTDYRVVNGMVVIEGDVNVETTCMVILALCSHYPRSFSGLYNKETGYYIYVLVFSSMIAVLLLIYYMNSDFRKGVRTVPENCTFKNLSHNHCFLAFLAVEKIENFPVE